MHCVPFTETFELNNFQILLTKYRDKCAKLILITCLECVIYIIFCLFFQTGSTYIT
jgi:hypothetical protein